MPFEIRSAVSMTSCGRILKATDTLMEMAAEAVATDLLCLGKPDYEALRENPFFSQRLGIKTCSIEPSTATGRGAL